MDITAIGEKLIGLIKKYRYVIFVLLIGVGLMLIPDSSEWKKETPSETVAASEKKNDTDTLAQILMQIKGAGKVQIFLSIEAGEKIIYQTDTDTSTGTENSTVRTETVIITNADRAQQALVQQVLPPKYLGAIVVCQGGDDPSVRLAIVEAVAKATGLGADRISVLKMK